MKKYIVVGILIFLLVLGGSFPFLLRGIENSKIERKVKVINQLFQEKGSYEKAKKLLTKKEKSSINQKVSQELKKYFDLYKIGYDLLSSKKYQQVFQFSSDEEMKEEIPNRISYLQEMISSLEQNQKEILTLSTQKYSSQAKEGVFLSKLNQKAVKAYGEGLKDDIYKIYRDIDALEYLQNHVEEIHVIDTYLEFQKRSPYQEFETLEKGRMSKKISFSLVKDETPPTIVGENFSLYLNDSTALSSKIHCIDEVDGEVECQIKGDYNASQIGTYSLEVHAKDESGNEASKTIQVNVIQRPQKPYKIDVIRNQNVVIVYGLDGNGEYTSVVKVFVCSTGRNNATPIGTFSTTKGGSWGALYGGVWGQYTTRIVSDILFHSVPYYSRNKGDLEWEEYNKLGTQASLGCVRLAVRDVKWIYDNCPAGTTVHIYDGNLPSGISKPSSIRIDGSNPNRGWDPTDPDPANPWNY